jgi:small-conductance mechanosensitive channel
VNDVVKIDTTYGIVRLVTLRTTQIKTFEDNLVTVPNSTMANSTIINLSSGRKFLFSSVVMRVGYSEDLRRVSDIMKNAIPDDPRIHIEQERDVRFEFGDIDDRFQGGQGHYVLQGDRPEEPWIRSEVRRAVINAMMREHVEFQKDSRS